MRAHSHITVGLCAHSFLEKARPRIGPFLFQANLINPLLDCPRHVFEAIFRTAVPMPKNSTRMPTPNRNPPRPTAAMPIWPMPSVPDIVPARESIPPSSANPMPIPTSHIELLIVHLFRVI